MNTNDEWRLKLDRLGSELANRPSLERRVLDRIDEHALLDASLNLRPQARRLPVWVAAGVLATIACGVLVFLVGLRSPHPAFNGIQRPLPAGELAVSLQLTTRHHTGKEVIPEKSVTMRVSPRTGRAEPTNTLMAYAMRSSPDGRFIAINVADDFVKVFRMSGEEVGTVKSQGTPVWSPDSKSLLCSVRTDDGFVTSKYDVASGQASSTNLPGTDHLSDWSPDGTWLAVVTSRHEAEGYIYQIYLRTPDGNEERRVQTGESKFALRPRFSRDGKRMVFVMIEDQVGRIGVLDMDDHEVRVIPGEWDGTLFACWSPDGTTLAVKTSQTLGVVDVATGRYDELEIEMPLRAGRLERLVNGDLSAIGSYTPMFIGAVEWLQP